VGNGPDGTGDGVRDVVEFEVEKDLKAALAQCIYERGTRRVEELHAHLEPAAASVEAVDHIESSLGGGKVKRDREEVARVGAGERGTHISILTL
jgi:hypothetical protein